MYQLYISMKRVFSTLSLMCCLTTIFNTTYAQVTIGSGTAPDVDAVLELVSNDSLGLLLPRLSLDSEVVPSPLTRHVAGMVVYNVGTNLPEGYYFNNGNRWIPVADGNSVSWNNSATQSGATSNTQDIYQMGTVAVGTTSISNNTQFEVNSTSRGVLMPRMTTAQRNAIVGQIPSGLLIFNTTTNCFNYYVGTVSFFSDGNTSQWISLCGDYDPSTFVIISCDPPVGPSGDLLQGTSLSSTDTYTVVINVSVPGTYTISATAGNGYTYSKSGTFTETGTYTIVLEGQGTPRTAGTNPMDVRLNGVLVTPVCTLPSVTVNPAGTDIETDCTPANITINGTYLRNTAVNATHFVDIPVTAVTQPGTSVVTTNVQNGIYFSSGSVSFDGSTNNLRLFAQGTPLNVGTFTYTFTPPGGTICSFQVTTETTVGTFANPARNCLAILNEDPSSSDGEYFVQSASGSNLAVKTYCDMTNGGYTLIWSYSERTSYGTYAPATNISINNRGINQNLPANVVNTELGTINYYNYRLPLATMQNVISNPLGIGVYRTRIAYNPTDMNDAWGNDNYVVSNPVDKTYDFINTSQATWVFPGTSIPYQGEIFGKPYNGTVNPAQYNGVAIPGYSSSPYFGNTVYGEHWDTGARVPSANISVDFPMFEGGTITRTFNPNGFNNLFGFFGEIELNHLWGKCVNSAQTPVAGNDYDFTIPTCYGNVGLGSGLNHLVPHSFNGGEGRVLQWFVK